MTLAISVHVSVFRQTSLQPKSQSRSHFSRSRSIVFSAGTQYQGTLTRSGSACAAASNSGSFPWLAWDTVWLRRKCRNDGQNGGPSWPRRAGNCKAEGEPVILRKRGGGPPPSSERTRRVHFPARTCRAFWVVDPISSSATRLLDRLITAIAELGYQAVVEDLSFPELIGGEDSLLASEDVMVIPGHLADSTRPILLAVTKGWSGRELHSFAKVMRQVKARLIESRGTIQVVIVFCDCWDSASFQEEHREELIGSRPQRCALPVRARGCARQYPRPLACRARRFVAVARRSRACQGPDIAAFAKRPCVIQGRQPRWHGVIFVIS